MRVRLLSLFFTFLVHSMLLCSDEDQKKLIIILSTPRSLSTVFLRMMQARGDCFILCEPGVDAFTKQYDPEYVDSLDSGSPKTFKEVQDLILSSYKKYTFICIKEMGFAAHEYLFDGDVGRLVLQEAHFVFLVRDPHYSYASFYRVWPVISGCWSQLLDYGALYSMYHYITEHAYHKPTVITVDDLVCSPEPVVRTMCKFVDIPFDNSFLTWNPLSENRLLGLYGDEDTRTLWYADALQSSCFGKQTQYACDSGGDPTFEEVTNPEHRELYMELYRKNLPFYHLFAEEAKRLASRCS